MKEKLVITLYDSFTNIDDRFLQEVAVQSSRIKKGFFKKRVLLIAAIIGAILLCGFATYQAGIFDPWIQKTSTSPTETVQSALENQLEKEYTLELQIKEIFVDQDATERVKQQYKGSELAEENGWSDSYLEDNLIAVRAEYYVVYDHQKTFLKDGDVEQYFFLLRDEKTQKWMIWNNTASGAPFR